MLVERSWQDAGCELRTMPFSHHFSSTLSCGALKPDDEGVYLLISLMHFT
jgi:hypothetical protein